MLTIKTINNKRIWESFLLCQPLTPFFQSWSWGEVQEKLGGRVWRLGVYENKKLVGICLVVEVNARRGHYYHLRHGPVFKIWKKKYFNFLVKYLKEEAKKNDISFIRRSPLITTDKKLAGFINSPIHNMDAENAWVLDLDKSEEELLTNMRKTTRYLVKKGERSGLVITKSKDKKDISAFLKLYKKTASKHGFVPHRGIEEEIEVFGKNNECCLFLCRYQKKVISGAVVIFYGNSGVYHHGATDPKFEHLSPSYLVQWEAIKEAKRRGKKIYNFWGVAPDNKPNHPWSGLTMFKQGFGGRPQNFLHSQDFPLSKKYWKTYIIETIIRIQKGY